MKKEYDFSKAKVHRKPLASKKTSKIQKTLRLDYEVLEWAQAEGERTGLGYQTFINMTLREAMKKPSLEARIEALEKKKRRA